VDDRKRSARGSGSWGKKRPSERITADDNGSRLLMESAMGRSKDMEQEAAVVVWRRSGQWSEESDPGDEDLTAAAATAICSA
jgi:hypothetical protein